MCGSPWFNVIYPYSFGLLHWHWHCIDVIMGAMASQITSLTIVYSTVYSDPDKKHQSSASLDFVRGIHRWPVNSPHKGPVTRNMFPFDDVIMLGQHTIMQVQMKETWWKCANESNEVTNSNEHNCNESKQSKIAGMLYVPINVQQKSIKIQFT